MPRSLDLDEMRRDLELHDALYPILMAIAKLQSRIEDTYLQAGSEAYEAARVIYNAARANGKNAGIDASVEEMGRRFSRKNSRAIAG